MARNTFKSIGESLIFAARIVIVSREGLISKTNMQMFKRKEAKMRMRLENANGVERIFTFIKNPKSDSVQTIAEKRTAELMRKRKSESEQCLNGMVPLDLED